MIDVKNREKIPSMQRIKADTTKPKPKHLGKFCMLFIYIILITFVLVYIYLHARIYFTDKSPIIWNGDAFNYKNVHIEVRSQSDFKLKLAYIIKT